MPPFEVVGGVLQWKLAGMHVSFPMNQIQKDFPAKRHVSFEEVQIVGYFGGKRSFVRQVGFRICLFGLLNFSARVLET